MNWSMLFKTCAAVCVAALLICSAQIFRHEAGYSYENEKQYTAGGTTISSEVEELDIDWLDGSVKIEYHKKPTVEISETAPEKIPDKAALRWWLDGEKLHIRYAGSGFFSRRSLNKALAVILPEDLVLKRFDLGATSAEVSIPALQADAIEMALTSGDLVLEQKGRSDRVDLTSTSGMIRASLEEGKKVSLASTSGTIDLTQSAQADSVGLTSTSGSISADLADVEKLEATSTSGSIQVEAGTVEKAELTNTSGGIRADFETFDDLELTTTSGNVSAAIPEGQGLRAEIVTVSGSFDSAVALKRNGSTYSCGDESSRLRIHTVSGNIRLE